MAYHKIIVDALERLIQWSKHKELYRINMSFKIEILDEFQDQDEFLIPRICVHAITNERNELIDLRLSLGLFDCEHEVKSKERYDEIMGSRLGFMFGSGPVSQYNLVSGLGKNVKMASSLIIYFIQMLSRSKEIDIKPLYCCEKVMNGNLSLLQRTTEIMPLVSIQNLMDTMFDRARTVGAPLLFNVLKDNRGDSEFLAEVIINKWPDSGGFTAWIRTKELNIHFVDAMFKRFVDNPNKDCAKEFNIQDNSLDIRVEFNEDQKDDFIYFISDCLHITFPALCVEKSIAQLKYNYFSPVVQFYLTFYPDGKRPSDKELEYVTLLRDYLENDVDEEYRDPGIGLK